MLEGHARQGEDVPRHTHTHEDESFYLLEGQMTFQIGAQTVRAGEGDFVYLPRLVGHAWTSDTDARFIVFISPAGFETSFIEFSEPATEVTLPPSAEGPPPEAFLQALMARENELGVFYDFQQLERE